MSEAKFIPPSLIDCNGSISNIEMCASDTKANNKHMILAMLQAMRSQAEINTEMYAMLEVILNTQKRNYGNGMGLHLDMIDIVKDIQALLAKARGES